VGPRPEDACFVDLHRAGFSQILSVKPGITGLSQLAFAKESQILDHEAPVDHYISRILPQKVAIDSFYAENRSITMDVRVLAWTAVAVVGRRDVAVHRDTGRLSVRGPRPLVLELADIPLSSSYPGNRPEALSIAD